MNAPDPPRDDDLELWLRQFDRACRLGERPRIEDFLPTAPPRLPALVELVHIELEYRLRAGDSPSLDDYLRRFPELAGEGSALEGLREAHADWCGQTPDLPPSPRLDRYRLVDVVGSGGCATVYRGYDTRLDRVVAVKVPRQGQLAAAEQVERFLREAKSAAGLRHPAIVAVYDAGQIDGVCYLVSEFIPGATLAQRLRAHPVPPRDAVELVARLADALQHAHGQGVIHRDVKPSNILLDAAGRPYLCDFGLALRDAGDSTLTAEGDILGTPAYMAPEQARGEAHRVDGRTDVYSLGVVLYELLTGERPFQGAARMVLRQVQEEEPRPPRRLNDQLPRDLETACLKAMAKERRDRYASAGEFAADLRRFHAGEPVRARPVGAAGRCWRWARRKPAVAVLAGALLLSLAGGVVGVSWQWRQAEANYQRAREGLIQSRLALKDAYHISYQARQEGLAGSRLLVRIRKSALEHFERLEGHDDPKFQLVLVSGHLGLASVSRDAGMEEEAVAAAQRAWVILERVAPCGGGSREVLRYRAECLRLIAWGLERDGKPVEAIACLANEREVLDKLGRIDRPAALHRRTANLRRTGKCHEDCGQPREARHCYEVAAELYRQLLRGNPRSLPWRTGLAACLHVLGRLHADSGNPARAVAEFARARALREQIVRERPARITDKSDLTGTLTRLGRAQAALGRPEAHESFSRAEGNLEEILRDHPGRAGDRSRLAEVREALSKLRGAGGRPPPRPARATWQARR